VLCTSFASEADYTFLNKGSVQSTKLKVQNTKSVSLKESSDELNPPVVTRDVIVASPVRGPLDYLALAIATFGVGFIPIAPGTWGSLVGIGIYLLLRTKVLGEFLGFEFTLVLALQVITLSGIWAASRTERITGRKDPGKVVVDEVAGQLVSLIPTLMPILSAPVWIIVSFILFRFFDIVKPYPAREMERLHGGLGIMSDDWVAGIYAATVLSIAAEAMRFL
jgi:phosphatidylglycerophosphatase A